MAYLGRLGPKAAYDKLAAVVTHNLHAVRRQIEHVAGRPPLERLHRLSSGLLPGYTHPACRSFYADPDLIIQCVHPEDRRAFYEIAMQPFRPDCPEHKTKEFRIVRGDSGAQWVHAERVSIFRPGTTHDVVRIVGFVVEIPEPTVHQRAWQLIDIAV